MGRAMAWKATYCECRFCRLTGAWPIDNTVCSARASGEVCGWLAKLEDIKYRKKITERIKELDEAYMSTSRTSNLFFYLKLLEIER
jgi:hypothetical protein